MDTTPEEESLNQSPSSPIDDVENDHPSSQPHSPDASEPHSPMDNQNDPISPTSDAPKSPDDVRVFIRPLGFVCLFFLNDW